MTVDAPKIDSRDQQMLVEQVQKLALRYCPIEYFPDAWKDLPSIQSDKQADALIHIFARMMEIIIQRLNKVPDKNFLAFLDLISVRLFPPRIARAPLTFTTMAKGATNIVIPVGTQVAGQAKEREAVVFEIEKALTVIVPKLVKAVSLSPANDRWTDHSPAIFDKKKEGPEELFKGRDLVPHRICLGHKKLFGLKEKTTIILHVTLNNDISLSSGVPWEVKWYNYREDSPGQIPLIANGYIDPQKSKADNRVVNLLKSGYIIFSDIVGVSEKTLKGFEKGTEEQKNWSNNWIFAELKYPIQDKLPEIKALKTSVLVTPPSSTGTGTISSSDTTVTGSSITGKSTKFTQELKKGYAIKAENQTRLVTSINSDNSLIVNYAFKPELKDSSFNYASPPPPDLAFFNNFPLDLTKDFYPFGEKPKFNDTFYIGSKEVFSKERATITIMIALSDGIVPDTRNIKLLWESWDGKSWIKIGETNQDGVTNSAGFTDSTKAFKLNGEITFICPKIEAKKISGEENYWIRVRIIGGNYGQEATYEEKSVSTTSESIKSVNTTPASNNTVWTYKPPTFKPPSISTMALSYNFVPDEEDLETILTYNDFVYQDQTKAIQKEQSFIPFQPVEDIQPALYLAFDQSIATLPVTIFFPLIGKVISTRKAPIPLIGTGTISSKDTNVTGVGTYFSKELKVGDSIAAGGQTRRVTAISSDTVLTIDSAFDPALKDKISFTYFTSQEESEENPFLVWQYWTGKEWSKLKIEDNTMNLTKRELIQFLAPPDIAKKPCFNYELEYYWIRARLEKGKYESFPILRAMYTNTVWARNQVTVQNEMLGFSNGNPGQVFNFSKFPILPRQKVLVMELSLTEEEKRIVINEEHGKDAIEDIRDNSGNVIGHWVRWHEVVHFYFSKPNSRHYIIDRNNGTITFGDGERGMIPPAGKDNIKCSYKAGGGAAGNVKAGTITKLRTTFPYIDLVTNPEDADGGGDKEEMAKIIERGPQTLKHRDRAVTYEDFVWLVKEASPKVVRVKCLPTTGIFLQNQPGWVTLIIVPESDDPKPVPSQQLISEVESYISERTSTYLTSYPSHPSQINLIGPGYLKVWVEASVQLVSISEAKTIEGRIIDTLNQFFHPLYGGPEKKGWDFGRNVYISEVYAAIENTDGVDYVETLHLNASAQMYKVSLETIRLPLSYPEKSIVKSTFDVCLFDWDEIPGIDSEKIKLKEFLGQKYDLDWVKAAAIEKIDNNKTIKVFNENKSLSLSLNNEKTKVILKIDDGRTDVFVAETEKSRLNIYDGRIEFSLAKSLPKEMDINMMNVTGFKEGDSIFLRNGDKSVNLTIKSISHNILCDVIECESVWIEDLFPKNSTVETSNKNIKSFILNEIPAQSDISLTPMQVAILEAADNIVLIHRDNPLENISGKITDVDSNVDTIFIDDNYLVYSGTHVINKKKNKTGSPRK